MQQQSLAGTWQFRQAGKTEWLGAQVPGGVHTDLMAAGKIPDPFVSDHEKHVQWIAEVDWEYRRSFRVAPEVMEQERVYLVCDGLDTLATLKLNGKLLGKTDNAHRQYRWEIKNLLVNGDNKISIAFEGPTKFVRAQEKRRQLTNASSVTIEGAPHIRKAICQFGWDWGPMLPPIGIWKDIRLEGRTGARLDDVHLRQRHAGGSAWISADVTLDRWSSAAEQVCLQVTAPDGVLLAAEAEAGANATALEVQIPSPHTWWPRGYGEQPLYSVQVVLKSAGQVLDQRTCQMGLRTSELVRKADEWGESFTFVVNGVPIFAKGADWIPADSFPTRITRASLEGLLDSAAAAHMNMLRIWGGGLFESDLFYELCDQKGILVWQDHLFACAIYPLDNPDYLENLRIEVIENVRRLRHHASLVLWCGNNEMEEGWEYWGWSKPEMEDLKGAYLTYFHTTLPAWVKDLDPDTPYWPSSPSSNTPFVNSNSNDTGDAHYWDVWHGRKPFTAYRAVYPRFMSEFGFQALPPYETIQTYAAPQDQNMTSYIMEHHQRSGSGNGLIIAQMTDTFRMPRDFQSLVYLSMLLQAEGIRFGVEHWRRNKHRVSGTLYWQLNDCWPVASWASLDFFGRWKALHYAARRFYAPIMLSILDEGKRMQVHVTSDAGELFQGSIHWSLVTIAGKVLKSGHETVKVQPYASIPICSLEFDLAGEQLRDTVFVAELFQGKQRMGLKIAPFVPNKHLQLVDPGLDVSLGLEDGSLVVQCAAKSLARFVELKLAGADAVFSDNYFDVPGGFAVTVSAPLPAGWTLEHARQALQVRSLFNSF